MKKEEIIRRYGVKEYERRLELNRQWKEANSDEGIGWNRRWRKTNPEKAKANDHNLSRKGGKYYARALAYRCTGLQGERNKIRATHRGNWGPYKKIIAPDSQIHHEWIPEIANYKGVAPVEADQHRYGNIDIIQIPDGAITFFTEKEIREQEWEYVSR